MPAVALAAHDLFAVLDRAFRQRSRQCTACTFSLPFRVSPKTASDANWTIIPSRSCSEWCRLVLEDLVARHQESYRLQ